MSGIEWEQLIKALFRMGYTEGAYRQIRWAKHIDGINLDPERLRKEAINERKNRSIY